MRNKQRDDFCAADLDRLGWQQLIIWECETRDQPALRSRLLAFLDGGKEPQKV